MVPGPLRWGNFDSETAEPHEHRRRIQQADPLHVDVRGPAWRNAAVSGQGPTDPARRLFDAIGTQLLLHQRAGAPPPVLEEHEIEGILGAGGFGLVCRARHRTLHRQVALKLFPLGGPNDPGVREALREARSLARLEHPNIVTVHAVGEGVLQATQTISCAYVQMQLIEGGTLRAWAETRPHAAPILDRLLEAGRALGYAHEQGLLHRDFKPENVMVDSHGRARVIDFGLALATDSADDVAGRSDGLGERLTSTGFVRGTPGYIAPEASMQQPQAASDQFSFAVAVHELLTGRHPLAGKDAPVGRHPDDGDALHRRLQGPLDRAMMLNPDARFETIDALCDALESAVAPPRPAARWPWIASAGAVGLGAAGWAAIRSSSTSEPPAAASDSVAVVASAKFDLPPAQTPALPTLAPVEDPPPPKQAAPAATVATRSCADLSTYAGAWNIGARTMWTEYAYQLGWRSEFALDITVNEDCQLDLAVTKHPERGADDAAKAPLVLQTEAEAIPDPDGTWRFEMDLAFDGDTTTYGKPEAYHVVVTLTEDADKPSLRAVAEKLTQSGPLLRSAVWEGSRGLAPSNRAVQTSGLACAARCQLMCAGRRSQVACRRDACEDYDDTPGDPCGPASFDFKPPMRARSARRAVSLGNSPLQSSLETGSKKRLMPQCIRNGRRLRGAWGIWHTNGSGFSNHLKLDIQADDCLLRGEARGPGESTTSFTGEVTPAGTWILEPALTSSWFPGTFVLVGVAEDAPAFGVDADDNKSSLRAYRRPSP